MEAGTPTAHHDPGSSPWRHGMEFLVLLTIAVAVIAFLSHESEDDND